MLRKVPLDQVRIGMFVHAMEGSWLRHPFWRRRFLLDNEHDLRRLRDSDIPGIVVDDERGLAPEPPPRPVVATALAPARKPSPSDVVRIPLEPDEQGERKRAKLMLGKAAQAVMTLFRETRMGRPVLPHVVAPLVREIAASVARDPRAVIGVAQLKRTNEYTYMHSVAVCALMINFARTLEFDEALVEELGLAGLLHDIGKMGVPDQLLSKPGRLTDDEYAVVREHPQHGYDLIVANADAPAIAAEVILHHHERFDGSGYPHGLKGEQISLHARMGAICDVYDAITSNRPYKQAWKPAEAVAHMLEWDGQFDPVLLDGFIRSIGIYPRGTLVRLRSNRLGLVVSENGRTPGRPRVKAFYAIPERAIFMPEFVSIGPSIRDDAILKLEQPEHWNLGDWPRLRDALLGPS